LREARRADLPAEYTGSRGFRRRRAILSAVIAPTPSGVVAYRRPCLRVARLSGVDDVASVTILGLPARVQDPLPDRRAPWVGGPLRAPPACTDASGPCAPPSSRALPCWRMRDAELSACCTAACSMSACASRCRFRASGVDGAGMACSSVEAATSFWLARGGVFRLSVSKSTLMRSRAGLPSSRTRSLRAEASPAMEARSSRTAPRAWLRARALEPVAR
jgi:hypothetical protein